MLILDLLYPIIHNYAGWFLGYSQLQTDLVSSKPADRETAPICKDFIKCSPLTLSFTVHGWLTDFFFFFKHLLALNLVFLVTLLITCIILIIACSLFVFFMCIYPWCNFLFTIYCSVPLCLYAARTLHTKLMWEEVVSSMMNCFKTDPITSRPVAAAVKDIKSWCLILLVLQTWHCLLALW